MESEKNKEERQREREKRATTRNKERKEGKRKARKQSRMPHKNKTSGGNEREVVKQCGSIQCRKTKGGGAKIHYERRTNDMVEQKTMDRNAEGQPVDRVHTSRCHWARKAPRSASSPAMARNVHRTGLHLIALLFHPHSPSNNKQCGLPAGKNPRPQSCACEAPTTIKPRETRIQTDKDGPRKYKMETLLTPGGRPR